MAKKRKLPFFLRLAIIFAKRTVRFIKRNNLYFISASAVGIVAAFILIVNTVFMVNDPMNGDLVKILIEKKYSAKDIARLLYTKGIIGNVYVFDFSAKLMRIDSHLKAGTYYFAPNMTMYNILGELYKGQVVSGPVKLTIPEGSTIYRIARSVETKGIKMQGSVDDLEKDGLTDELRLTFPFLEAVPTRSLEGYLFPDTYGLPEKMTADALADVMLSRFEQVVIPVWNAANIKKYSLHQIITLASIIEKEAETDSERPIIASVFYNRLENGIALRADPTVKYALARPTKKVTYSELKVNSPYNTYLVKGLPPGPICNPGLRSILAAMHPAKTKYLYFVSNGDGTHTFSENWAGHAKAVERYRSEEK